MYQYLIKLANLFRAKHNKRRHHRRRSINLCVNHIWQLQMKCGNSIYLKAIIVSIILNTKTKQNNKTKHKKKKISQILLENNNVTTMTLK